jgi:AbrB family looped-hinge helix DNA binding protein
MSDNEKTSPLSEVQRGDSITYKSNTSEVGMRITTKGQVTIPLEVRERLGLLPHTEVEFTIRGNTAVLTKAGGGTRRGRALVQHMRGRGGVAMTTDQILALTRDAPAGKR